ncbi:MAG: hypothetical protein JSW20_05565 [Nitrospiraceae bacterium]|nr:MAG: hypothetical protein JSW20_05565 [Nitrospiraceae bacterium]
MEDKKKLIIAVIASLIIGIMIGTGLKGDKKVKKPAIKQVLQETVQEFENLERENKELKALAATAKEKSEADKKRTEELSSLKVQLNKAQLENRDLKGIVSQLKSQKPKDNADKAALKSLSEKHEITISSLEKENQNLKMDLQSAQDEITNSADLINQLQSDVSALRAQLMKEKETLMTGEDIQQRMTKLEKENQELKSIVESINKTLEGR